MGVEEDSGARGLSSSAASGGLRRGVRTPSTASLTLLRGRLLVECLMASRQVEGLRAQIASDIKATLSEAATPLAVAGLPCGGYPITRFYVIGGARTGGFCLMQSNRHRTRTRVHCRV